MCCMQLAANAGRKKLPKSRHLCTILQLCRAISSQVRHMSTIGKKTTSGWDLLASLEHPCKFQWVLHVGSVTARHSSIGRQPNFAALNRGRHLCSAGRPSRRPSRWAVAYILVILYLRRQRQHTDTMNTGLHTHSYIEMCRILHRMPVTSCGFLSVVIPGAWVCLHLIPWSKAACLALPVTTSPFVFLIYRIIRRRLIRHVINSYLRAVCLSVRPSVRLSHAGIARKRLNLSFRQLSLNISLDSLLRRTKYLREVSVGSSQTVRCENSRYFVRYLAVYIGNDTS